MKLFGAPFIQEEKWTKLLVPMTVHSLRRFSTWSTYRFLYPFLKKEESSNAYLYLPL